MTHLLESGGEDATGRIYAGVDAKRSSARPSVRSGSTKCEAPRPSPHDNQPHHSSGDHDEVMLDSLEEGQLLEDDPYLSDSMLKELGRFGMEGLG